MKASSWKRGVRSGLALVFATATAFGSSVAVAPQGLLGATIAAGSSAGGLNVSVGYAEDKETNNPNPAAFPVPWVGAPNTTFLGGTVPGQTACGTLTTCYDAGAIRLDNPGTADVTVSSVSADIHSSVPGGKAFSLWGSFTVPAGKSVILTENPPTNNPGSDNFDTSGYPGNICTPVTVAPTVTITIAGVPTTLVDSTHVLDTGGIDRGYCGQNESIQWRAIGAAGSDTATLTLGPASASQPVGGQVTETALLQDGGGAVVPNVTVGFTIIVGPNAGVTGSAVTDATGHASFTYGSSVSGTDIVVASVTTVGSFRSNQASVTWGTSTNGWTGVDIGSPPVAGSDSLSNGTWTISGSGRDIGGTADQLHLVWQPLAADGGANARVLTQTNTNSRARAGVMLRQSTDAGAPFYALVVTPGAGLFVLQRPTTNANVVTIANIAGTVPAYVSVLRSGSIVTAYTSPDGVSWTPVAGSSQVLGVSGTVLAGMAVTSHSTTALGTATFGSVSLPTAAPPPPNNFTVTAKPSSLSVAAGAAGQTTIGTGLISGSAESITLSATGLPAGVTAAFSPASVTTGGSSTLTFSVGAAVPAASYSITVTGTSASATHSVTVKLTVTSSSPPPNNFSMSASPSSVSVVQGAAGGSTISTALVSGSAESISLAASGLPAGVTAGFSPASVTAGAGSALTLTVGSGVTPGTYPLTVTGTAPSATHTTSVSLTVTAPVTNDFSMSASPSSVSVVQGAAGGSTISTALVSGSAESISLAASGLPAGVTAGFSPASVTAGAGSALTLTVGSGVTPGTYPLTVTGTAPSATHTTSVSLTVTAPVTNDFSMSASPSSVSVVQGAAGGSTISTALVSGSAESISLAASGLPAGVTAGFSPASVTAGAGSALTLTVGSGVTPGTYPLTVTGTAPSATHTTSVSLTVTASTGGGLPSPWTDADIGSPAVAGSATYAGGVFTVSGSGADIYGTYDQFHYVYQPVSGNGTLIARVTSQTNTGSSNSKAGLIWKASTSSGSPYFLIAVNNSGVVKVQWKFSSSVQASTTYAFPNVWMKMVRSGSSFTAFLSSDGVAWTQVASTSLATIPTAATLGLEECSHVNTKLGTATFDNVSFTPGP